MPGYHQQRDHRPGPAPRPAPEPSGELVAAFARPGFRGGPDGELRVSVDEYQGHSFISLRLWERGTDGEWWPTKKGISVRLGEAEGVADALMRGLELAGGVRDRRVVGQARREPYRLENREKVTHGHHSQAQARPAPLQRALPAPAPADTVWSDDFDEFADPARR